MLAAGAFTLGKILLTHMGDLKKVGRTLNPADRYVRPGRRYDLPENVPGMRHGLTEEKYQRDTRYCNPAEPEIVALAHHLGAFEKTPFDYARDAFEFVKRNLTLEIMALDGVAETLRRGTGTCLQINSVYAALCRTAGIPARYKLFSAVQTQAVYEDLYDPMMQQWYDALGYFSIEGDVQVCIDGEWIPANAAPTPERQAAMGSPITQFGESAIGVWFEAIPGTIMITESLPYGVGVLSRVLMRIAPGTVNTVNVNIQRQIARGRDIIARAGGETAYDEQARTKKVPKMPTVELQKKGVVIEG
jgi:hypothetical protein